MEEFGQSQSSGLSDSLMRQNRFGDRFSPRSEQKRGFVNNDLMEYANEQDNPKET